MKNLYCTFLLFTMVHLYAQENPHQFSINAAGIFVESDYDQIIGKNKTENGFQGGIEYRYYLSDNWSLGTGIIFQQFNSYLYAENFNDAYLTADIDADSFEFRYKAKGFKEELMAEYLMFPINIQYETSGVTAWYANLGGKIGINVSANYKTSIDKLTTSGYYPIWNVELFDPKFMGFGEWEELKSGKSEINLKTIIMLSAESGVKQKIGNRTNVYIGLYFDYGLNNIIDTSNHQNTIEYNPSSPQDFILNSVTSSVNSDGQRLSNQLKLMSFGAKLKFAWK